MAIVVGLEATVCQVPNLTESSQEIRIHAKKKKSIIILGKWDNRQIFRKAILREGETASEAILYSYM